MSRECEVLTLKKALDESDLSKHIRIEFYNGDDIFISSRYYSSGELDCFWNSFSELELNCFVTTFLRGESSTLIRCLLF